MREALSGLRESRRVQLATRATAIGVVAGAVGGMATFVYGNADVSPVASAPWVPLVLVVLVGAYVHLLSRTLRESVGAAAVTYVVGAAVSIGLWVSPIVLLEYTGFVAELAAAVRIRDAVVDVIVVYLLTFGGSYLGAVVVGGFLE